MLLSSSRIVTVFGGSGFVGRHVVRALAYAGWRIKIATRSPHLASYLLPLGVPGQIALVKANVLDQSGVSSALEGASSAIYLPGIFYDSGKFQTLKAIHVESPRRIAEAAAKMKLKSFIHLSALGAHLQHESQYAQTKALGEEAVLDCFTHTQIIRPSVIFGPEDRFFNFFAQMAIFSPFLPLISGGGTKFQPVFVGDVAKAIVTLLEEPPHLPTIWEFGGPSTRTLKEILTFTLKVIKRRRFLLNLPRSFALFQACFFEYFPKPPLTRDQVKLLDHASIVSEQAKREGRILENLGIAPASIEEVVPHYLARYRKGGQFSDILEGKTRLN